MIKTYKGGDEEAVEAYEAELEAYKSLQVLQGVHIPRLLFYGPLQDTCNPTLVLEHCGTSLDNMPSHPASCASTGQPPRYPCVPCTVPAHFMGTSC